MKGITIKSQLVWYERGRANHSRKGYERVSITNITIEILEAYRLKKIPPGGKHDKEYDNPDNKNHNT